MDVIRVFIADDHELVRMALRTLLEAESDFEVVGEAGDCPGAVAGVDASRPDVLLLDLRMPGVGGIKVCREVRAISSETAVLIITSFDNDEDIFGALEAGAAGYILKDTRPDRIAQAVRTVFDGQTVLDAGVAHRVVSGRSAVPSANSQLVESLSEREIEVLRLMARGLGNKEIARELWIGETTVKTHVSHVLRKLGQGDRTQAVLAALRMGIVDLTDAP